MAKVRIHGGYANSNTQGKIDKDADSLFTSGHCHSLAFALHRLTNWPIYGVEFDPEYGPGHTLILSPYGWLDINGLTIDCPGSERVELTEGDYEQWYMDKTNLPYGYFRADVEMAMPYAKQLLFKCFGPKPAKVRKAAAGR